MDNSRTCGTCEAPLMMPGGTTSIFESVQPSPMKNNFLHYTSEISMKELIVRRGQPFDIDVKLTKPFDPKLHPLKIVASTGEHPSEDLGTATTFGIPDTVNRSASAKAVWKVELHKNSDPKSGKLVLSITPPADAPIGEYTVMGWHRDEQKLLAKPVVLFNPWCRDDQVYMENAKEVEEYVMNEQGVLYRGSKNYIMPLDWDLGQFEEDMVKLSLKMLDISHKHIDNPAEDVASRSDPVYVGRVISAMINSVDDHGVLEGNWGGNYGDGFSPSHWNGSHAILKRWYDSDCKPVKYGQCWVFAGVMCSVMRLLGVPTRTISNFASAHDTNGNLTIDRFHAKEGVTPRQTHDSVWNFHVWTESYMKRPDLSETGKYDGWQVLDPTPQEMSDNVYCCGPASVKAIRDGQVNLKYDCPFVFAEVNADIVEWLVKEDGSQTKIESFPGKVGINTSTKAVNSKKRVDVTDTYKPKEGSEKERAVFKYAVNITTDYSATDGDEEVEEEEEEEEMEENDGAEEGEDSVETEEGAEDEVVEEPDDEETEEDSENEEAPAPAPVPPVVMTFVEVTHPTNGKDVRLKLKLKSSTARQLSINISVQAMHYNGRPAVNIKHQEMEKSLVPGKALLIPIRIPFIIYHEHMINADSMNVSAVVTDMENPDHTYLADDDVVLLDPPISLKIFGKPQVHSRARGEVVFRNPANKTLTNCHLTLSGSGLWRDEVEVKIPDLKPKIQVRVKFFFFPYKVGKKTAMADFDCSSFKDIKVSCPVKIRK
ncbi:protein-glutamine gamma-glutamyltransferase E [Epinephelus moara]|uniref:protein-glutamine gamma-glutamyltransferase E n=1 Tax=Epinephelus moara TaxID=300413 RepID=UPI00214EBDE2|nr:protein-glutamine gamma-glutamyltransferase E [Epinephelus moara]